jgi:hypothetical protein
MSSGEDNRGQPSFSTDLKSDIAFMNKQKKLRAVYRDFRSAVECLQNGGSSPSGKDPGDSGDSDTGEGYSEAESESEIDLIIQEIDLMQTETDEIIKLISNRKFSSNRRFLGMRKQLLHLKSVNANLIVRAESLLEI